MAVTLEQAEPGVLYRLATVNGFSGSLTYRISQ
jgi:hypothetical protein